MDNKRKKRIIIIHGFDGSPEKNWFPWLKGELEKLGHEVMVPRMPNKEYPVLAEWVARLQMVIGKPDENMYLVGHSLGVITILRFLESLPEGVRVGGVILVAGFPEQVVKGFLNSFFEKPLEYERVKKAGKHFIAVHSDDDPYVPIVNGEILHDRLGAELIVMKKAGHLTDEDGFYWLPVVLEKINHLMRQKD